VRGLDTVGVAVAEIRRRIAEGGADPEQVLRFRHRDRCATAASRAGVVGVGRTDRASVAERAGRNAFELEWMAAQTRLTADLFLVRRRCVRILERTGFTDVRLVFTIAVVIAE
jgi:hypothetical protein